MKLGSFLDLLGKEVGQELSVQDDACTLLFDDMKVVLQENGGQVMLYGVVGPTPPYKLEKLYAALLMGNHLFAGTTGATLSQDPESQEICLCKVLDSASMPYDAMRRQLEQFVETLEKWKNVLAAYRPEDGNETAEEAALPGTIFRV